MAQQQPPYDFQLALNDNTIGKVPVRQQIIIEQVHDEIWAMQPNTINKPQGKIENRTANATLNNSKVSVINLININGECIDSDDKTNSPAYAFPNNMDTAIIRDCFRGVGVPGLNNVFDQATSSLDSFINYHYNATTGLVNPMSGPGGLGQQLLTKNPQDNRLVYTAYFNYDLLMFAYIYQTINKRVTYVDNLYTKAVAAMTQTQSNLLTPTEIKEINVINLNYLWQRTLDFCEYAIVNDNVLNGNTVNKPNYLSCINALRYMVFTDFTTNTTGFLSDPTFKIIDPTALVNSGIDSVISYIENTITKPKLPDQTLSLEKVAKNLDTPYFSSQPMAAKSIQTAFNSATTGKLMNAFNKFTGCKSRKKTGFSPEEQEVIFNMNALFHSYANATNATNAINKHYVTAAGWAMLKFTGDTSHVVFGNILEKARNYQPASPTPTPTPTPPKFNKTLFLVSEIVLATRLVAAGKDVLIDGKLQVFTNGFNGLGSENKYKHRYALKVVFDPILKYKNYIQSIIQKYDAVTTADAGTNYPTVTKVAGAMTFINNLTNDSIENGDTVIDALNIDFTSIDNRTFNRDAEAEFKKIYDWINSETNLLNYNAFINAYNYDTTNLNIKALSTNLTNQTISVINKIPFAKNPRIKTLPSWFLAIDTLEKNADTDSFADIMTITNALVSQLKSFPNTDDNANKDNINKYLTNYFTLMSNVGFETFYNGIIAFYYYNPIRTDNDNDNQLRLIYKKEFVGNLQEQYIIRSKKKILTSNELSTKVLNIIDGFKILIDNICLIHAYRIKSGIVSYQGGGTNKNKKIIKVAAVTKPKLINKDKVMKEFREKEQKEEINNILDQLTTSLLTVDVSNINVNQTSNTTINTVTDEYDEDALFDEIESPEDIQIDFSIETLEDMNIAPESRLDFNKICADRFYNIGDINEMEDADFKKEIQAFNTYINNKFNVPIVLDNVFAHIYNNIVSDIPVSEFQTAYNNYNKVVKNNSNFDILFGNPNHREYFVNYINSAYNITIFTKSQIVVELNDLEGKWENNFYTAYVSCLNDKTEYDNNLRNKVQDNDKMEAIHKLIKNSIIVREHRDIFFRERGVKTNFNLRTANIWQDMIYAYNAVSNNYTTNLANLEGGKRTRKNRKSPNKSTRKNTKAIPTKRKYTKRNRKQTKTKTHKRKP